MAKFLLIVALLAFAGIASASLLNKETLSPIWASWKAQHKKAYSASEERTRFGIFVDNFNKIQKQNAESNGVQYAVNGFADLTASEFKAQFANGARSEQPKSTETTTRQGLNLRRNLAALPDSVDWRNKGAVTAVKNQGQCKNGGYAFATAAALESFNFIKTGELLSFSEQQILDCASPYYAYGCSYGWTNLALEFTAKTGIALESEYPYIGVEGDCSMGIIKTHNVNTGYEFISFSSSKLKAALVNNPVIVRVEADEDTFQFYKSGVVTTKCGAKINHAVLVVGYQKVGALEAFIVKNSWGTSWGQDGYIYISTIDAFNSGKGACGILSEVVNPL